MVQIIDLPTIAPEDISGGDWLIVWDTGAATVNTGKMSLDAFLTGMGVVRAEGDATLGVVDADELNAPLGAIDALTIATSLTIGATISKALTAAASVSLPDIAANASGTATMTVTGALTGDVVMLSLPAGLPAGMIVRGDVTGSNTVTVRAYNATASTITAASYSITALLVRVA